MKIGTKQKNSGTKNAATIKNKIVLNTVAKLFFRLLILINCHSAIIKKIVATVWLPKK
jgi:hypothetical protein